MRFWRNLGSILCEGNELIIRRIVGAKSNKQFVNSGVATLGVLKRLGQYLIDLHGPHDHQSLLSPERQMAMLDAYAGAGAEMQKYRDLWSRWREAQEEYELARAQREVGDQEKELLRFQVEEIDNAELKAGEEVDLEERFRRTSNASRLGELAGRAGELLNQDCFSGIGGASKVDS